MSSPSQGRGTAKKDPRAAREAKRAASQRAAAERAAAKRRKQLLNAAVAVVVAVGLIVAGVFLWRAFDTPDRESPDASSSAALDPALATKPTVTAGSGTLTELKVTTLVEGKGTPVESGQQITVHYVGVSYTTGKEFDSSWKRAEPTSFSIGTGNVIQGWDKGLVGVKVGSRVQLDIPTDLAYGPTAEQNGKPPGPLRFVVDIRAAE